MAVANIGVSSGESYQDIPQRFGLFITRLALLDRPMQVQHDRSLIIFWVIRISNQSLIQPFIILHRKERSRSQHPYTLPSRMTANNFLLHLLLQNRSKRIILKRPGPLKFLNQDLIRIFLSKEGNLGLLIELIFLLLEYVGDHYPFLAEELLGLLFV